MDSLFKPVFGGNQAAISGLGMGMLANAQSGRKRNFAEDLAWGLKSGLSIKQANDNAKRQKKLDDMNERKLGMESFRINNQINSQAQTDQRQQKEDVRLAEKRAAFGNYAQSYNPNSSLFTAPGALAGAGDDRVNQFRIEQGLMGGVSPKTFSPDKPKLTSQQQNALGIGLVQGTPEYNDYIKQSTIKRTFLDPLDKPITNSDIRNLVFPKGVTPPIGVTYREARDLGASVGKKPVAAESAGKQAMIDTALAQGSILNSALFPDASKETGEMGAIDQSVVRGMAIKSLTPAFLQPLTYGVSEGGQKAYAAMENRIQGQTRLETGAAMPPGDIDNSRRRFQPFPWDAEVVQRQKLRAMDLFLGNAKKYFDPNIDKKNTTPSEAAVLTNIAIDRAFAEAALIEKKKNERPPLSSFSR